MEAIPEIERALDDIETRGVRRVRVDLTQAENLGLTTAWLLRKKLAVLEQSGATVEFNGAPDQFKFLDDVAKNAVVAPEASSQSKLPLVQRFVAEVGRAFVHELRKGKWGLGYFGRVVATATNAVPRPKRFRLPSLVRHVYETGIQAVPIVALIAFLISVIIAYLGAQQLRTFGAEIFTVDLVAISVLREMGVLLTAIIVAGRSGSAFAAEIGVMQLNEEVDAVKSMGLDPFEVLVLPRVTGLVIALPLLTIVADATGLAGGAILSAWLLDIPFTQFVSRVQGALAPTTFWAGLVKAPVFAILIAMVGTYRGMQVRDSSRELGRLTTAAVVQSIFLVILADAIFAIVFVKLDF